MTYVRSAWTALCAMALMLCGASAMAQSTQASDDGMTAAEFMAQLHPIHGDVKLPKGNAELHLGTKYYFLNAEDAKRVIVEAWGNPPDEQSDVMGMIVAEGSDPLKDWGAVVTYEETNYITDKDADKTDYNKMLKEIQDGEGERNAERQKAGFGTSHLVGWAQPPTYDKVGHTMIWAQDLRLSNASTDTLNYDVRLLGRRGVLSLNMVDLMPNLPKVREQARDLALAGAFTSGSRYDDYQNGDKKAAYGIGGLVAAGLGLAVAKKLGLLGLILAFGKKIIVFVIAGAAAVARWFGSIFGGKKKNAVVVAPPEPMTDAPPALDGQVDAAASKQDPPPPQEPTIR